LGIERDSSQEDVDIFGTPGAEADPVPPQEPPDPAVQLHRERLNDLFHERQSLLAKVADAENTVQETEGNLAEAQQQLNNVQLLIANLQMQFLQVQAQLQAALKQGDMVRAAALRRHLDQMRLQELQLRKNEQLAQQQIAMYTQQLKKDREDLRRKQQAFLEFCPKWAQKYDFFGNLPKTHQQQTVELCSQWLEETAPFPEAYLLRGFALSYLDHHEQALRDFTELIQTANGNHLRPLLEHERGRSLAQQATLHWVRAHAGRVMVHSEMGREAEAKKDLAEASKLAPKSALLRIASGRMNAKFEHYRAAEDDFLRATKLAPRDPTAYCEAAALMLTSPAGNKQRALELSRKACELTNGTCWRCLDAHAVAAAAAGDFQTATKLAKEAASLAPAEVKDDLERHVRLCKHEVVPPDLPLR
jgi:hypothetical protein